MTEIRDEPVDFTKYNKEQMEICDKIWKVLDLYTIPKKSMFDIVYSVAMMLAKSMAKEELR